MRRRALSDEQGAILILFAILLTVLMIVIATVIDLGALRADARADQTVADFSATAAAADLAPQDGGTPSKACKAAWDYFLANTPDAPKNVPNPCATFTSMPTCSASAPAPPRIGKAPAGPYTVSITYPVINGHPLMDGRLVNDIDGDPCLRIGVEIARDRQFLWGGIINARSGGTTMRAVARAGSPVGGGSQTAALIILDPDGCNALVAKGQTQIEVASSGNLSGIIAVDSSATLLNAPGVPSDRRCNGQYAIDAFGTQNSAIRALDGVDGAGNPVPGRIWSYAMMPGQGNANAYEPGDLASGRLRPLPVAAERIGRTPVDWRYDCRASNSCPGAGAIPPHITDLRTLVGTSGAPAGFKEYPKDILGAACATQPSTPALLLVGNWWINCPNFSVSNPMTFTGGNVIFQGNVSVGSSGVLSVNVGSSVDRWVYFRSGDFQKDAQASILMERTFVYMHNGRISFGAGSGITRWIAPVAGGFEDLTLWSESSAQHELGGQAQLDLEGVFFTPNAYPFRYAGQGGQAQAKAQFITYRLEGTGQGTLLMKPDPERSVQIQAEGLRLLR